jgi:predicted nucleic-acid-binding Zn-ribbon protein
MQCPKCSSENTQRLELIFESGTQQIRTTSNTVGGGGGFGGGGFGGGGVTTTSGTQQTESAKKAAPPAKKSYAGAIILAVIAFPVIFNPSAMYILVAAGCTALAVWLWRRASDYNTNVWPGLKKIWLESWMCNKCGNIYQHAFS